MCQKLTGQKPFLLVYGVEVVMPMEYIVPSLCIVVLTGMKDHKDLEERLAQLEELEEEWFLASFISRSKSSVKRPGMIAISSCTPSR